MTNLNNEKLTFEEVAVIVFESEQANGLHEGVTFEQWFATKQEANETTETVEEVKTEGNDYTVLIETLNGKVTTGQIMRTLSYLNKKDIGTVTKVELEERNGDLVGYVYGTNNNFRVWQSVRVSPRGKQHFKVNVSKL